MTLPRPCPFGLRHYDCSCAAVTADRHTIRSGQVYESCQPTFVVDGEETHTRIRVVGHANRRKVWVATLDQEGRELRPRWLQASQLHATGATAKGEPRRSGYRFVSEPQGGGLVVGARHPEDPMKPEDADAALVRAFDAGQVFFHRCRGSGGTARITFRSQEHFVAWLTAEMAEHGRQVRAEVSKEARDTAARLDEGPHAATLYRFAERIAETARGGA